MTLEDFFSLTEMKDGLTAPSRVEELVCVMQKEKDCVVKNPGDAARQWAAVASTIAATENRDCLDRFIQLDGLVFIDSWLKDALNLAGDSTDSFIEESIMQMLRALEKLHVDNERSVSSGIWITVESLLGHSMSQIKDRARALVDSWKEERVINAIDPNVEGARTLQNDEIAVVPMEIGESSRSTCSDLDIPPKAGTDEENNRTKPAEVENLPSSAEDLQPQRSEGVHNESCSDEQVSKMEVDHADMGEKPSDCPTSIVVENSFTKEKSPVNTAESSLIKTCSFQVPKPSLDEGQSDAPMIKELPKDEPQLHNCSIPEKIHVAASATVELRTSPSRADVSTTIEAMMETATENILDTKEGDVLKEARDIVGVRASASAQNSGSNDVAVGVNHSTQAFKTNGEDDEHQSDAMPDSSSDENLYRKHKDLETSLSRIKDIGATDEDKDPSSEESSDSGNSYDFLKPKLDRQSPSLKKSGTTDGGMEFGIVDALEVARNIAQEVAREVVDYREPSCSSSENNSEGGTKDPNSLDSMNLDETEDPSSPDSRKEKQEPTIEVLSNEGKSGQNSANLDPDGKGCVLINSENVGQENGIVGRESSQVTVAAREPEGDQEKGMSGFDLNLDVCSDDMDHPVNPVSATVSVVSASRATAASGLPAAPLQFEGALGWKGSAATSAFRPASPRRVSDGDTTALTVGGSKQRQDFLDFDLNVAENADEKNADLMSEKQVPVTSSLHSTESSVDVSPRKSDKFKLDLNRISDDSDAPPSDFRIEGRLRYFRNGLRSPSPASSSSSMQPSLRNFDLNDQPLLQNDFLEQGPYHSKSSQNVSTFGFPRPDKPAISIMGTRVEVNRRDFTSQLLPVPNGKAVETAVDLNTARASGGFLGLAPATSYTHAPVLSYNGLSAMPTMPYNAAAAMYGHGAIPYIDSRGAPVVPQIVGSAAAAIPPSYSSQPQFMMSMTSTPSGINIAGPSRQNFDLNTGFPIEGGNREALSLRQFFAPGQVRSMDDHFRGSSQLYLGTGASGKRKEPDGGWEPYPFMNRPQQPPWK